MKRDGITFVYAADEAHYIARDAKEAMRAIPAIDFTERVAMELLSCLQARLAASNWSHTDHGVAADESVTDAHLVIENAVEHS